MKTRSIFSTLFLSHLVIGGASILSVSFVFYLFLRQALIRQTQNQLSSINILKKNHIEDYFQQMEKELVAQLENQTETSHQQVIEELNRIKSTYHFKSLVVVDELNHIVLQLDADRVFLKQVAELSSDKSRKAHFQMLDISDGHILPITQLVYSLTRSDRALTVFILDDFAKIQRILNERTGMGSTGESYLVAMDRRMRSESRFLNTKKPLEIEVKTQATKTVFEGKDGMGIIDDYRGVNVISVYRKLKTPYLHWAIISEIDFVEATKPITHLRNYFILIAVLTLAIVICFTAIISNLISKPILHLKDRIELLALGKIPATANNHSTILEIRHISFAIDKLIYGYEQTALFADQIGSGQFDASFHVLSEYDIIGKSLIQMRDRLKELSDQQIRLLREKASALLQGQENERKRIVQDLHDGVGQHLTGIRLQVQALQATPIKQNLLALIDETITEVKRVSYDIMPSALVDFGLKAAFNGLCEYVRRYSQLSIDFTYIKEIEKPLPFEVSIAVFRLVQEAFNNILKHANATQIDFYVRKTETELYLFVKDNGIGFDPQNNSHKGIGLQSMAERAKLLGGYLELHSMLGEGTTLEVTIPIKNEVQDAKV